ncbi:MAG: GGDEF domain-containing protein [Ectothiorhodospiraceae bacterium]|nr:GGDEF domain-containing protein [Ectothiorhodospiraceae bacterium]
MPADDFDSICALTREASQHDLCERLLESVHALMPGTRVRLFEAYPRGGREDELRDSDPSAMIVREWPSHTFERPRWFDEAVSHDDGWRDGGPVALGRGHADLLVIALGRTAGLWRFLEVAGPVAEPPVVSRALRVAIVFRNLLALLDSFERDPLTGLYNRRTFDTRMQGVMEDSPFDPGRRARAASHWLAILDIDHFKRINDTYGHLYGDEILLVFARLMQRTFRFDDLLFRYGGEEFIVVLTNTSREGAATALERFRGTVASHVFPHGDAVTVSIGWTGIEAGVMPSTIMDEADTALYQAKDHGRDRVVAFERAAATVAVAGEVQLF